MNTLDDKLFHGTSTTRICTTTFLMIFLAQASWSGDETDGRLQALVEQQQLNMDRQMARLHEARLRTTIDLLSAQANGGKKGSLPDELPFVLKPMVVIGRQPPSLPDLDSSTRFADNILDAQP